MIFMNTLCDPYYDMLVGNGALNFIDLVIFDKMIECTIKSGRMDVEKKEEGIVQKMRKHKQFSK